MPDKMAYTSTYVRGGKYSTYNCIRYHSFDDTLDHRKDIVNELIAQYGDDPKFSIVSISPNADNPIDYALIDRMKATRLMCELGHRVRGDAKIKVRQPLRKAYVAFQDSEITSYMIYRDKREEYATTICEELNVANVEWVDGDQTKFFDYSLQPNFRSLGPKNLGKQAQLLKSDMAKMSNEEANALYAKLKTGQTVDMLGVPLSLEDVIVSLLPKPGFAAASDKVGAIILDTKLDDLLLDRGTVAEFCSEIQKIRKDRNFDLSDRIELEVSCIYPKNRAAIENMIASVKKRLLATEITFHPDEEANKWDEAHKIDIGEGRTSLVNVYQVVG
jgi:isoleucyl-tRNA synthetase